MKRIFFTLLSIVICFTASAQKLTEADIPAKVKDAFKAKFSIAEKVSWEMDYDNFQVTFNLSKAGFASTFDKDGNWLETDTYLKPSELPKEATKALSKEFGELSNYKVNDPQKTEMVSKDVIYEMEVEKNQVIYYVAISEKGELLKKEELKKE